MVFPAVHELPSHSSLKGNGLVPGVTSEFPPQNKPAVVVPAHIPLYLEELTSGPSVQLVPLYSSTFFTSTVLGGPGYPDTHKAAVCEGAIPLLPTADLAVFKVPPAAHAAAVMTVADLSNSSVKLYVGFP